jgi:serine/arginine repetitive matrix protein 1
MRKVELSVMRPWIAKKINELLGFEDEVVIEYVSGLLEDENNPVSPTYPIDIVSLSLV